MSSFLAGKVLRVGSPTSLALHAHAHFHPSTTLLPSRDFPIQALVFPNSTSISFFIPPINTVFYLIEQLIQYFVLLNGCDIPPINTVFYLIEQLIQYFGLLNGCDKRTEKGEPV